MRFPNLVLTIIFFESLVTLKRRLSKLHDCLFPEFRATPDEKRPRPLLATFLDGFKFDATSRF